MSAGRARLSELVATAASRGLDARLCAGEADPGSGDADPRIANVRFDSRLVEAGDLFVAVPGTRVDGSAFVADALRRGAVAVVCDPAYAPRGVPAVLAADVAAAGATLASAFYGDPSDALDLVGITGTNGKTSCTYLMEAVWKAAAREPGVIGTIVQRCRAFDRQSAMTTPSCVDLQHLLAEMREAGCDSVAMEVSSHALDQRRVAGCRFRAGLFTNLTRDHLDYHGTMEAYFVAKAALFRRWLAPSGVAVLNADDVAVATLAPELSGHDVWTTSSTPGTRREHRLGKPIRATVVCAECTLDGIHATFDLDGTRVDVRSPLVGAANLSNLLSVAALARGLGIGADAIGAGLSACPAVPGRMQRVFPLPTSGSAALPAVFVDYAHTPDALERSLKALAEQRPNAVRGRIIVVFGCGGDRDRGKRPIMGRLAADLADVVVLTSDNPRSEDPLEILREIESGIEDGPGARMIRCSVAELAGQATGGYLVEADRLTAIETAIALAGPQDVVIVAGKGHENYQETAGKKRHFDDREVVHATLLRRAQG